MDVAIFAQRLTRTLGIEPYLERLLTPGLAGPARFLVLMGLALWVLVVVCFVSSLHFRYVLRQAAAAGRLTEELVESGRKLRRPSRRVRWVGHTLLLGGIVLSLGSWVAGASHPFETLTFILLVHFGVMQPCWLIAELYGGALADQPRSTSSSGTR